MVARKVLTGVAMLAVGVGVHAAPANAAPAWGGDPAVRCQHAIEEGGYRYTTALLDAIERCALTDTGSLAACLDSVEERASRDRARFSWGREAAGVCAGVELKGELGYFPNCAPPPSSCMFPSTVIDAPGPANDLLDCLACQIDERLRAAADLLFAGRGIGNECQEILGQQGLSILRLLLTEIHRCLDRGERDTIAGCLEGRIDQAETELVGEWRSAAEAGCGAVDPFRDLGYLAGTLGRPDGLCAGVSSAPPPDCGNHPPACAFPRTETLSAPGADNDLLDCLQCQVEEAALGVARAVYGAEVCCAPDGCRAVRSRVGCRRVGGAPALYEFGSLNVGIPGGAHGIAIGADGTIYTADTTGTEGRPRVTARSPAGLVTVRGTTPGPPFGIAVDPAGDVFVALRNENRVVRIAPDGTTTPFAGSGQAAHAGDGGPALDAAIAAPNGVAVDDRGNVYITESGTLSFLVFGGGLQAGEHVRMVDRTGTIHTVAGAGPFGAAGIGKPALAADLGTPYELAANPDGSLLIGEVGLQRVLRIDPSGLLQLVAGRPLLVFGAYSGDGGPAVRARLYGAEGVGMDSEGKVFVADMRNNRIRLVDAFGSIITVAGWSAFGDLSQLPTDGTPGIFGDAGCPGALAVAPDGRVYYPDMENLVRVLTLVPYAAITTTTSTTMTRSSSTTTTIVGCGRFLGAWGALGSANGAFNPPTGVAVDARGVVFVADAGNNRIQKFDGGGAFLAAWGSSGSGNGQFSYPEAVAVDGIGNVFVADTKNNRIQKFDNGGVFLTAWGTSGTGPLSFPHGVAVDGSGDVFVAEDSDRIDKFDNDGGFLTAWGSSGSGNGQFNGPFGLAVDAAGNVFVADTGNNRIQKFDDSGTFLTAFGSGGNAPGQFNTPQDVAVDGSGNVFVTDGNSHRVQRFDAAGIFLSTWGGPGNGDGFFDVPWGIDVDGQGNVFVADSGNDRIQKFGCP